MSDAPAAADATEAARKAAEAERVEAEAKAEEAKAAGNACFAQGQFELAIEHFSNAIELSPSNYVYYSNRSAAYLSKGEHHLALADAQRCISLKPDWWKGYSRKAAAFHALLRFDDAIVAFRAGTCAGLSVSPANPSLTQGLQEAQAAKEGALKREAAVDVALAEAAAQAGSSASGAADAAATAETVEADNELMGEFLSEIQQSEKRAASADPTQEIDRLLQRNFQWKNLNPFEVLQLPSNASEDDVKRQYKKLSMLIHPDKVSDPRAGEAFQELKKAYEALLDGEERARAELLVRQARVKVLRERKRLLSKGVPESALPDLQAELRKESMKTFAQAESRKRVSKRTQLKYKVREREQEEAEKVKAEASKARQAEWDSGREVRVGSWRDFVSGKKRGTKRGLLKVPGATAEAKRSKPGEEYKAAWK